jgi:hypothetical protein
MVKQAGMGDGLHVAGYDLSGDIGSLGAIAGGNSPLLVTGIDKSAPERNGGLRDGRIEYQAWFNPTSDRAHDRLSNLPTTDQILTYYRGQTAGNRAAALVGKQINYDPSRAADGSLSLAVEAQANGFGLEWGRTLFIGSQSSAGVTAGIDFTASSAFGLQAYLQLVAFTGTSITVTIQESADDAVGDPYANVTGGAFASASAVGAQRIATSNALTVERWLRLSTAGTFSAATFAVVACRNEVAGQVF